jgi:hypothetical protein
MGQDALRSAVEGRGRSQAIYVPLPRMKVVLGMQLPAKVDKRVTQFQQSMMKVRSNSVSNGNARMSL